ncbi:hypothetical protein HETIRDRAFT_469678 [Heterobasidion irregulare TC 32-1]|uniref:Translin n=1 Tax=Heterobasidion irregulare (strain TC 32-1) TaxID=747525 RepID=W4KP06_HETIT|nr:uncharacterized protein HETIRDRAFT_469678 [Heterobasidion irregulare TC 32-1]ETW87547.1 hypothetical protein HETIRDRAFT_469678 [Heterobasidion irregulare TC 32-1]
MSVPDDDNARSAILRTFVAFREELDDYNDRRERLIKSSRDITNLSKKVIFLLHRVINTDSASDDRTLSLHAAQEGRKKLGEVQLLFKAMRPELTGDRFWRYQHSVSPGLQEYIEALSFAYYIEHGMLITYADVQRSLSDEEDGLYFPLPVSDYLLGVSDLTGELMRFAISSISKRGPGRSKASEVSSFVRGCKADFDGFTPHVRELSKKQHVTQQSLLKIEQAAYTITVRSSEYDLPPEMLDDIVGRHISRFSHGHPADRGTDYPSSSRKRHRHGGDSDDERDLDH